MTPASIIGFIVVCVLACVAGWAAVRWVESRPPPSDSNAGAWDTGGRGLEIRHPCRE